VNVRPSIAVSAFIETERLPTVPLHIQAMHRLRGPFVSAGKAMFLAFWVLANIAFAGMRAQNSASSARVVAFTAGLPVTLVTLVVVTEGSERAFGIDLPRK